MLYPIKFKREGCAKIQLFQYVLPFLEGVGLHNLAFYSVITPNTNKMERSSLKQLNFCTPRSLFPWEISALHIRSIYPLYIRFPSERTHPFPSRTRQLSFSAPKIHSWRRSGKTGLRWNLSEPCFLPYRALCCIHIKIQYTYTPIS